MRCLLLVRIVGREFGLKEKYPQNQEDRTTDSITSGTDNDEPQIEEVYAGPDPDPDGMDETIYNSPAETHIKAVYAGPRTFGKPDLLSRLKKIFKK